MTTNDYDAIVIGAGAGGLFTAARLARRGYRTLLAERLGKVGGRASTTDIDGFKVNDGAIVIEVGGITQQTCEEVGAKFEIREPAPPILYRVGKKDVDVTKRRLGPPAGPAHPPGGQARQRHRRRPQGLRASRGRDLHRRLGAQVHQERGRPGSLP